MRSINTLLTVIIVALLAITVVVLGLIYKDRLLSMWGEENQPAQVDFLTEEALYTEMLETINRLENLTGYVYFFSRDKETNQFGNWAYPVSGSAPSPINIKGTTLPFHVNVDAKEEQYLFVGNSAVVKDDVPYNPSIYLQRGDKRTRLSTVEETMEGYLYRLRMPRFSPDGKSYVYSSMAWQENLVPPDLYNTNAWNFGVGNLEGTSTGLSTNGFNPNWALGGKMVVYLKANGIFGKRFSPELSPDTPEIPLLSTTAESFIPNNHTAVSPEGSYLIISKPRRTYEGFPHLDIYKITENSITFIHRISLEDGSSAYWPVFSPGGRYISMQVRGYNEIGQEDNSIKIYDLVNRDFVQTLDFNKFDFDISFNTDWGMKIPEL